MGASGQPGARKAAPGAWGVALLLGQMGCWAWVLPLPVGRGLPRFNPLCSRDG